MESSRSKLAAVTASVVPFHCVICFDEFNLKDRTPMVLPCGHTYVCCQCTKRLKRCMECREPLFIKQNLAGIMIQQCNSNTSNSNSINGTSSSGALHLNNHHSMGGGRYSPPQQSNNNNSGGGPPSMTTLHLPPSQMNNAGMNNNNKNINTIPLPIPKNVVLMSMMEAAQRQQADAALLMGTNANANNKGGESNNSPSDEEDSGIDDDDDDEEVDDDDEEEFNLDRIISGMATLSGPCGTYSVTDEKGLAVYATDPRVVKKKEEQQEKKQKKEEQQRRQKELLRQQQQNYQNNQTTPKERVTVEEAVEEEKKVEVERESSDRGDITTSSEEGEGVECDDGRVGGEEEGKEEEQEPADLSMLTRTSVDDDEEDDEDDEDDNKDDSSTENNINFSSTSRDHPSTIMEEEDDEEQEGNKDEPYLRLLKRGDTVQVVDFQDGVAKLARGEGYIAVAKSSQLVKVGGPLETSCRLEGLLDTIASRGRDLQSTLDENRQIEANLRKQIEAEMEKEPCHPVVVSPTPDYNALSSESKDSESTQPLTPTGEDRYKENSAALRTPDYDVRHNSLSLPGNGSGAGNGNSLHCPRSPNSIDNADIERSGMPGYRRAVSEDDLDHLAFGCGAAILGQNSISGLWGEYSSPTNSPGLLRPEEGQNHDQQNPSTSLRPRTMTDTLLMHAAPTLTSSFDGIDFRTGLSGHRGLSNASKQHGNSSPTPRGRQVRLMMSAHNGISRLRAVPQRPSGSGRQNSPTGSHQGSTGGPSFAPRFSPFPGT